MSRAERQSRVVETMGPSLITFNKSYVKRFEEYKVILGAPLPAAQVLEQWCDYLEYGIEPKGWYGLWNISRELCEDFNIPFPSPVFVLVEAINFRDLTAQVKVTGVMDDIHLPECIYDVPLQNIYPTREQENNAFSIHPTAECLDQFRIFYNHLWWPWDTEEFGETSDWVTVHLEKRLQLYFDMLAGELDYEVGAKIRHYIDSGKDIHCEVKELEELINEEEGDGKMSENEVQLLIKRAELDQIKTQLLLYEIKDFRTIESKKKQTARGFRGPETTVVMSACFSQDVVNYMHEFEKNFSDTKIFQFCSDPQEAVSKVIPGDSIVISPGTFSLSSSGVLERGGAIIGMMPNDKPLLKDKEPSWSFLEFCGNTQLSSLNLEIQQVQSAIMARRGTVTLKDVTMKSVSSLFNQAIVVLKNAVLEVESCTFTGFNTAIVANEGATVVMRSCTFENNSFAVKLCEGADVTLNNCSVYASKNCAIQIESGRQISQISSMDVLKTFPGVKAVGLTIQNSSKGDVQVVKRRSCSAFEDSDLE